MRYLLSLIIFLFPLVANSQVTYGIADFNSSSYWPRTGLLEHWTMDAMVMGDLTQGQGDMESGVAGGNCTYCPTGFTCACVPTTDITQEVSKVWKNDHSLKVVVDASANAAILVSPTFIAKPNVAYQITWRHKGETGVEDIYARLDSSAPSVAYYNFTTNTWGAGESGVSYNNIATSWTTANLYFINDSTQRTCYVYLTRNAASQTFYIDDLQIRELHHAGPTGQMTKTLTPAVTSDQRFGDSSVLLPRVSSGPLLMVLELMSLFILQQITLIGHLEIGNILRVVTMV